MPKRSRSLPPVDSPHPKRLRLTPLSLPASPLCAIPKSLPPALPESKRCSSEGTIVASLQNTPRQISLPPSPVCKTSDTLLGDEETLSSRPPTPEHSRRAVQPPPLEPATAAEEVQLQHQRQDSVLETQAPGDIVQEQLVSSPVDPYIPEGMAGLDLTLLARFSPSLSPVDDQLSLPASSPSTWASPLQPSSPSMPDALLLGFGDLPVLGDLDREDGEIEFSALEFPPPDINAGSIFFPDLQDLEDKLADENKKDNTDKNVRNGEGAGSSKNGADDSVP